MPDRDDSMAPSSRLPVPRFYRAANAVGVCLGVVFGLALYFGQGSYFGLAIAVWSVVGVPMSWRWRARKRRTLLDPAKRSDRRTGRTLTPPAVLTGNGATEWTGAADVPMPFGRINATNPLALLAIEDSKLTFRVRPVALARLTGGIEPLALSPDQVEAVFPARARLRAPAIGIRPRQEPPYYFLTAPGRLRWYFGPWSSDRASILGAIEAAGFPVDWAERAFSRS